MQAFDVVVLGGGAAGLMCAQVAGRRGRRVVVLEGSNRIGKKILMSGGGRCNFTNIYCEPTNFLSANPNFCISALRRYTPADFIAMVERHSIPWHEKEAGQLFCDRSSKDIVRMLEDECRQAGVSIVTHCSIATVKAGDRYVVDTDKGSYSASSLVVATGGLSIPKMGASDFGYRLARQFRLEVQPTCAGLVPFTFSGKMHEMTGRLSGVSVPTVVSNDRTAFAGNVLFTHRGLSGPAALQISSYWQPGEDIALNLLPGSDAPRTLMEAKKSKPSALLRTVLSSSLPRAVTLELQSLLWPKISERPLGEIAADTLRTLGEQLSAWHLRPAATEGYRTAEVTLGGVDTTALSSKTMESLHHPGLFFIGEVVDVTGHLGGFNFQWAWASGQAAGEVA